jgi:hypothetical protein
LECALPDRADLGLTPIEWVRAAHAVWLVGRSDPSAIERYARDPSPIVRLNLVEALSSSLNAGLIGLPGRRSIPVAAFLSDPDSRVRDAALDLLDP